jgi:hypothetical protein
VKQPDKPKEKSEKEKPEETTEKPEEKVGIVQPMIDELRFPKDPPAAPLSTPRLPGNPPQPAELDQDAGGGYNPDGTYPQT